MTKNLNCEYANKQHIWINNEFAQKYFKKFPSEIQGLHVKLLNTTSKRI